MTSSIAALTERGDAVRRNIRDTVREIEAEWEQELGVERFAQLRQLLVELNTTAIVSDHHRRQPT
jgi:hypothetical protein